MGVVNINACAQTHGLE